MPFEVAELVLEIGGFVLDIVGLCSRYVGVLEVGHAMICAFRQQVQ